MKDFLHRIWPPVAVVAITLVLALQIPRKALFFSANAVAEPAPFASFVEYDAQTYGRIVQKARMSWQVRARGVDPGAGIRVDDLGFDEEPPAPAALPLPRGFSVHAAARPAADAPAPLLPPSVADAAPPAAVPVAPDDGAEARALRAELLALPASLSIQESTGKESTP